MRRADVVTRDGRVYEHCVVTDAGVRTVGRKPRDIPWSEITRVRYWRTTRGAWGVPPRGVSDAA
jgi:ribosomal protein L24E